MFFYHPFGSSLENTESTQEVCIFFGIPVLNLKENSKDAYLKGFGVLWVVVCCFSDDCAGTSSYLWAKAELVPRRIGVADHRRSDLPII
jgi:hypothetical protein